MPSISVLTWYLIGLLVKNPEKLNYINLTEENKEIQYSKSEKVTLLIQYVGSITFIFDNEALLRNSVEMRSILPFSIAIVLLALFILLHLGGILEILVKNISVIPLFNKRARVKQELSFGSSYCLLK